MTEVSSDLKEVLRLTGSVLLFDQKVMGPLATALRRASEVVCEVFIRSTFLCKNSSLAASSFSGFGPEDREALSAGGGEFGPIARSPNAPY